MCGIAGIIHQNTLVSLQEIDSVNDALKSRGPDARGTWVENNVALGHRRLSIIDLEDGHQPMFSSDENYGIVFNGEIYNYRQLRNTLVKMGYIFKTNSDTEVLLYAYIEWKEKCLNKLRGMFSFAVLDKINGFIFLARDHLGIKPLVYYHTKETFAFASEIRALKKVKNTHFTLDISAIDEYLWLQYIPAPKTVFNEVKKLKPAHYMHVSFNGEILKIEKYWDLDFVEDNTKSEEQWLDELDTVLKDSVKAHLVSDVPFGAFLSGGIDSSLVVKYMSEISESSVDTFSIGFKEEEFNELKYARNISSTFKTIHHEKIVTPDALKILPDLVSHYGEPFGDSSAVPTYYVSKLARENVSMVLSGDGADEIFAGYNSYKAWQKYHEDGDPYPKWKRILRPPLEFLSPKRFPPRFKHGDKLNNWLTFINYFPPQNRSNLWKKDYQDSMSTELEIFEESYKNVSSLSPLSKVQYLDIKTYLPFDILTKVDVASMMHGLEVRTPFVDKKVYEFAATIPNSMNFSKVEKFGSQGKVLLKKILEPNVSKDFLYRKKMGFAMPLNQWFHDDDNFYGDLNERLLSSNSMLSEYFERDEINKIIQNKNFGPIWLLLFLDEWLRQENL